jgi:hypothetical protein
MVSVNSQDFQNLGVNGPEMTSIKFVLGFEILQGFD